ncbi:unnamed protein product [Cunninghamella blakesleeana]
MNKHIKVDSTHPKDHHYFSGTPTPPKSKLTVFNPQENHSNVTNENNNSNHSSTASPPNTNTMEDELSMEKMDQIFERKRKRRESHNVVERRRRDNINARIDELSTLLPVGLITQKLNRGVILENSVKHIRILQQKVEDQQQRIKELELLLGIKNEESQYVYNQNNNHDHHGYNNNNNNHNHNHNHNSNNNNDNQISNSYSNQPAPSS